MKRITVIGAGAWGTALAMVANRAACDVTLWDRNPDLIYALGDKNQNDTYLPGVFIDPAIRLTNDLDEACEADLIVFATPAQSLRTMCISMSHHLQPGVPLLIGSKGIERGSVLLMSEVAHTVLPGNPIAILSGPNFAHEIGQGLPAATTIACENEDLGEKIVFALGSSLFRPYYSNDLIGTQIGGAVKNVIAIACGIAHGVNLGENARAAIITRGLAEMRRLCMAKRGKAETLMGLSGIGDLMLTCSSVRSRNFSFGVSVAKNEDIEELIAKHDVTTEGIFTAEAVVGLGRKLEIELPICRAVDDVIRHAATVPDAIQQLMARPLGGEFR